MKPEIAMQREVQKLKAERGYRKKGRSLLREGSDMKFVFIAKHRAIWPVAWLCNALGVSRPGFHAWLNRLPSARSRSDEMISMSRSKNVWNNAALENFFSSLKTERIARIIYRTRNEAKAHVFGYIERFYNTTRLHSAIGCVSPVISSGS